MYPKVTRSGVVYPDHRFSSRVYEVEYAIVQCANSEVHGYSIPMRLFKVLAELGLLHLCVSDSAKMINLNGDGRGKTAAETRYETAVSDHLQVINDNNAPHSIKTRLGFPTPLPSIFEWVHGVGMLLRSGVSRECLVVVQLTGHLQQPE